MLIVRQPESGLPLDRFLAFRLGVSRKQAKKWLDARCIFVNRKRIWIAHHPTRTGDVVEVVPYEIADVSAPPPQQLKILYKDDRCIVIDKPPGLPSVGPKSAETILRERFPEVRPVHRLDRDTSGCLLFARGESMRETLEKQFEERAVCKIYLAVTIGPFPEHVRKVEKPVDGQPAITEFRLLRRGKEASLVEARPLTGRTHQIRLHLRAAGHPIAGDKAYATREISSDLLRHLPRQMLHAWRLSWRDPVTGERKNVVAPIPADFRAAITALNLSLRGWTSAPQDRPSEPRPSSD